MCSQSDDSASHLRVVCGWGYVARGEIWVVWWQNLGCCWSVVVCTMDRFSSGSCQDQTSLPIEADGCSFGKLAL